MRQEYSIERPCPACGGFSRVIKEDGIHCAATWCDLPIPEEINFLFTPEDKKLLHEMKVSL